MDLYLYGWQIMTYLLMLMAARDMTLAMKVTIVTTPRKTQALCENIQSPAMRVYTITGMFTDDTRMSAPEIYRCLCCSIPVYFL